MKGIDISKWQGTVDFAKVKADGIEFCIFREGYRQAIDGQFKSYVTGAKAAGIPILGVYHFIYIDGATAKQNAEACIANMKAAGLDPANTWIFSDLEYDTWTKAGIKVTKALCTQYTIEFLETLKAAGCKKLSIYCNIDYYRNYYDWSQLGEYRKYLWLADYTGGPDYECAVQQTGSKGQVNGIVGNVDMNTLHDVSMLLDDQKTSTTPSKLASKVVEQAQAWIGCNEADGSHKKIIDLYNSHKPLARGYAVKYTDAWCSTFASACAIAAGVTDIFPTECGCQKHIELFKALGEWEENDAYVPSPGDVIFYDWDDNGVGDNTGNADHIGIVESVSGNAITVIEGNYSNSVKRRTLQVNGKYIRGYGVPKYDTETTKPSQSGGKSIDTVAREVISGQWGNGDARKNNLVSAGYDYNAVQSRVNEILSSKTSTSQKSVDEIAKEVLTGKWGNGDARKKAITNAGYDYGAVQARVNELCKSSHKSTDEIAKEVIAGKWGNGQDRINKLKAAGYNPTTIQNRVNQML